MFRRLQHGVLLTLCILGLLLSVYVINKLSVLVLLIVIAIVLTTGIDAPVHHLQKAVARWWRMPRAIATLLILLLGLAIILGVFAFLIFTAINESISFARETWPGMQERLLDYATNLSRRYPFLPNPEAVLERLRAQSGQLVGYLWSTTRAIFGVIGGIFSLITTIILTFFFATFKEGIIATLLRLVPPRFRNQIATVGHHAALKMGGWLRGQLILALIITISTTLAMWAMQVSYPALIGLIGGIGELIPMVGPYVAFFPAIAIVLISGGPVWQIVMVVLFFIALSQIENYILSPKIMERHVGLHPVTTILALLAGGGLLGLVGALLAIPLAAAGRVIMLEVVFPAIQGGDQQGVVESGSADRAANVQSSPQNTETAPRSPARKPQKKNGKKVFTPF